MPREPLPLGGRGTIRVDRTSSGAWQGVVYTRDADGARRRIKATTLTQPRPSTSGEPGGPMVARHAKATLTVEQIRGRSQRGGR